LAQNETRSPSRPPSPGTVVFGAYGGGVRGGVECAIAINPQTITSY